MQKSNPRPLEPPAAESDIFDKDHLSHYTMNLPELAAEVVALFIGQLPLTLAEIEAAASHPEWRMATHALKGAASSVGAGRIRQLAAELEDMGFDVDDPVRLLRIQALKAAVAEFREVVRRAYP
jgi:HPt (histidine-containing phosphotransfer) domain-containing protein